MAEAAADITVRTADGRDLRVSQCGTSDGLGVIFHHGWPGSRLVPASWSEAAEAHGIRLVTFDRAGYGRSSRHEGRTIASVASDTAAIADALGLERFGVWGVSGGGPHALACVALLPGRALAAAVVAGAAPPDLPGLDFTAGMGESSVVEFPLAEQGVEVYEPYVREAVASMLAAPDGIDEGFEAVLSPVDSALMRSGRFDAYFVEDKHESLGGGHYGWLDDGLATMAPWGFDLAAIEAPVLLVQGGQDLMVPEAHARGMAAVLPNATLEFHSEEGHMTLGMEPDRALEWLAPFLRAPSPRHP